MIEVSGLTKKYGHHLAIDRLNFTVRKGEVVGFLGPNGAGKSTTMKIITGYMAPTEGIAKIAGFDVFDNPIEVKKRIGYLPETPPVYVDMRVENYLRYVAELKAVPRDKVAANVDMAIQKMNLGEVRKRMIGNLSKGFRQRVGIAQALVSDPEVLILDEPTVGLDPKQVAEIRELIKNLRGRHTIILSTHILPEVQATCERIIIIHRGKIVAQDSLENLGRDHQKTRKVNLQIKFVGESVSASLSQVPGVLAVHSGATPNQWLIDSIESDEVVERIVKEVLRQNWGLLGINSSVADLEDIFLKLTYESEAPSAPSEKVDHSHRLQSQQGAHL